MHHFRPELRPLRTALAAALLTLLVAAQHAGAQAPASAPATRVTASVDAGVSRVAGEWVPQVGGALTFRLSRFIAVGGAGRVDVTHPELAGQGSTLRMRFGYGGLQVVLHPAPEGWPGLRLGALLAAGNVDVQDRAVGAVLDSDNGAVLEPSMSLSPPADLQGGGKRVPLLAARLWIRDPRQSGVAGSARARIPPGIDARSVLTAPAFLGT